MTAKTNLSSFVDNLKFFLQLETLNNPVDEINQLYDVFLQQLEDLQRQNDSTETDLKDAKSQIEDLERKIASLQREKVKLHVTLEKVTCFVENPTSLYKNYSL